MTIEPQTVSGENEDKQLKITLELSFLVVGTSLEFGLKLRNSGYYDD